MESISILPEHWQMWYHQWDSVVPETEHKRRLQGDLLSKPGSEQSYSAALELFLFSKFNNMGLKVDFQPLINGANPDFYILDGRGNGAYVEAGAMFNNPLETELSNASMGGRIWEEFKKLESQDFTVHHASCSGNPGNVSPRAVKRAVQQWINQQDPSEIQTQVYYYVIPPCQTFQFGKWTLEVELRAKTSEEVERLGAQAVELAGFSGGWSDTPAERLKSKVKEKSSQVRKSGGHSIVAITERLQAFSEDDVQTALFGGNCEYSLGMSFDNLHPYTRNLSIPQPQKNGIWSSPEVQEPIAVIIHRGNLIYSDHGDLELWLNPNSSYFRVPFPLFTLKLYSEIQKIWVRPATGL